MQPEMLWAFVLIFAIDSVTPGPAVAMVMSRSASVGLRRTLPFIAGLVVGDLFLFGLALLGLVALVKALGPLFFAVKWLGVAYLLYLAYRIWTAEPRAPDRAGGGDDGGRSFLLATLLPLGNPKAVGFYVALLPAFMDVEDLAMATAAVFGLAIVLIWSVVLIGYAGLADRAGRRLGGVAARRWLNRGSAGAMAAAAGVVASRD